MGILLGFVTLYLLGDLTEASAINLTYRLMLPSLCLQPDFFPSPFISLQFLD